jgi:hypothetical protein
MVVPTFLGAPARARNTENTLPTLPIHVFLLLSIDTYLLSA